MHHTLAWSASAADATLVDLTPVPDPIITVSNGHFFPQRSYDVLAAVVMGTNAQRVRIVTPKLRQVNPLWLRPMNAALVAVSNYAIVDMRRQPLRINGLEEVEVDYQQTSGGAQRGTVIQNWQLADTPMPPGDIYNLRGTSVTAAVANAWTQLTTTWETNLPAGIYAVVWANVISTNQQAFRLIIENQVERPGWVGVPTTLGRQGDDIPETGFGEWGRFRNTAIPIIETLCNAADAVHEMYLSLVQLQRLAA